MRAVIGVEPMRCERSSALLGAGPAGATSAKGLSRPHSASIRTAHGGPATAIVPARSAAPSGSRPQCQRDQRRRGGGDHGVVAVAGVVRADLRDRRAPTTSQYRWGPRPPVTSKRTTTRACGSPDRSTRCARDPQREVGVVVLGAALPPPRTPGAEGHAHLRQLRPARRQPVPAPGPRDHALPLQRAQPPGQHAARDAGRAREEVAEPVAADHEVAQDDRRPALGEDLGTQRDRAVLAVALHAADDPPARRREGSLFCELLPALAGRQPRGMTTAADFWTLGDYSRIAELIAAMGPALVQRRGRRARPPRARRRRGHRQRDPARRRHGRAGDRHRHRARADGRRRAGRAGARPARHAGRWPTPRPSRSPTPRSTSCCPWSAPCSRPTTRRPPVSCCGSAGRAARSRWPTGRPTARWAGSSRSSPATARPAPGPAPTAWGDPATVTRLLAPATVTTTRSHVRLAFDGPPAELVAYYRAHFPPICVALDADARAGRRADRPLRGRVRPGVPDGAGRHPADRCTTGSPDRSFGLSLPAAPSTSFCVFWMRASSRPDSA